MDAQKTVPVNAELFDRIEEEAEREGKTPEELVQEGMTRYLALTLLQRLQRYGAIRARDLGIKESDVPRLIEEHRNEQRSR
jgi:hypothetical protein